MFEDTRMSINSFKFKPSSKSSSAKNMKDIIVGVTTDGRIQYWQVATGKCVH